MAPPTLHHLVYVCCICYICKPHYSKLGTKEAIYGYPRSIYTSSGQSLWVSTCTYTHTRHVLAIVSHTVFLSVMRVVCCKYSGIVPFRLYQSIYRSILAFSDLLYYSSPSFFFSIIFYFILLSLCNFRASVCQWNLILSKVPASCNWTFLSLLRNLH